MSESLDSIPTFARDMVLGGDITQVEINGRIYTADGV